MAHGLNDALQHIDVFPDGNEKGEGYADTKCAREHSAPATCAGESPAGILNLVAHNRGEFESDQTETDHAKGIEDEARVCRNLKVRSADGGSEPRPDNRAEDY